MSYGIQNVLFGQIIGKVKKRHSILVGIDIGPCIGKKPKFYKTEGDLAVAWGKLSTIQQRVMSPCLVAE